MFSVAFSSLLGQEAVHRRSARALGAGDCARWFAACAHPQGQSGFLVKRLGSSDVLHSCPPRFLCHCTALTAQLKLKLCQAGEYPGTIRARCVRSVDPFAQRPEHDLASRNSRIVVITSAALRPNRSIPTTTIASLGGRSQAARQDQAAVRVSRSHTLD
jgi:hypothetical protein